MLTAIKKLKMNRFAARIAALGDQFQMKAEQLETLRMQSSLIVEEFARKRLESIGQEIEFGSEAGSMFPSDLDKQGVVDLDRPMECGHNFLRLLNMFFDRSCSRSTIAKWEQQVLTVLTEEQKVAYENEKELYRKARADLFPQLVLTYMDQYLRFSSSQCEEVISIIEVEFGEIINDPEFIHIEDPSLWWATIDKTLDANIGVISKSRLGSILNPHQLERLQDLDKPDK